MSGNAGRRRSSLFGKSYKSPPDSILHKDEIQLKDIQFPPDYPKKLQEEYKAWKAHLDEVIEIKSSLGSDSKIPSEGLTEEEKNFFLNLPDLNNYMDIMIQFIEDYRAIVTKNEFKKRVLEAKVKY